MLIPHGAVALRGGLETMRQLAIAIAIAALPALASAQAEEDGPDVVFVESSEVEIVVEEEDPGTPFVEQAPADQQALPPPPQGQVQAQGQVDYTVPAPPNVQLNQRALLQQRLSEHPLGGPIVMLAVGIPVAGIFGYAAYLAYHVEDGFCTVSGTCGGAEPNRDGRARHHRRCRSGARHHRADLADHPGRQAWSHPRPVLPRRARRPGERHDPLLIRASAHAQKARCGRPSGTLSVGED